MRLLLFVKWGSALLVFLVASLLLVHGLRPGQSLAAGQGLAPKGNSSSSAHAQSKKPRSAEGSPATQGSQKTSSTGPLLSSMPYAQAAYAIYPGTMPASARRAIDGFRFDFASAGHGQEKVTAYVSGQTKPITEFVFAATDKLYFVETNMGDDAANVDLNGGDDGLIMTDAAGHIIHG